MVSADDMVFSSTSKFPQNIELKGKFVLVQKNVEIHAVSFS